MAARYRSGNGRDGAFQPWSQMQMDSVLQSKFRGWMSGGLELANRYPPIGLVHSTPPFVWRWWNTFSIRTNLWKRPQMP